uniref:Pyruvate kinase n=2 Tax=Amphora coffeiformis TaxID=265554 RepID=A0A7S3KYU4_9STRA
MSISQSSEVPMLAGGFITLDTVIRPTDVSFRKTKIVCTIGPACWDIPQLETLMETGMNVARFNFSHGDHAGHGAVLERVRQAARNKQRNVAIMLDTKGPEIRSGFFANEAKKIELVKGETIVLTTDYTYKGDSKKLACSYEALARSVKPGNQILVADGSLVLTVLNCDEPAGEVSCRIENNASIGERKNMNLPGVVVDLPTFTEKDVDDIVNFGIKHKVDFIAASFVRKAADVQNLRQLLAENGGQDIRIICKIENQEGLENYSDILQATDAIMVARGDLGMEIPPSKVFLAQKMMIREANMVGKPVITATQMLESMIDNPRPTRAECSDVANAVLDGTDVVMLSGETANGPYFEQAVRVMSRTCCEAENSRNYNALFQAIRSSVIYKFGGLSATESLASSAVKTAIDVNAKMIVVLTESGRTARFVAKFRPGRPIVCLTPSEVVARQSGGLYKGVHAYVVDNLEDDVMLAKETAREAIRVGVVNSGDLFVVVSGNLFGKPANNQVRVEVVPDLHINSGPLKRLISFEYAQR